MDLVVGGVPWFPQEFATEFYLCKGLLSLLATVLVVLHMSQEWSEALSWGRRLRYLTLLYIGLWLTSSTVEQVNDGALVSYRNLGGLVASILLLVAMVVSIAERHKQP